MTHHKALTSVVAATAVLALAAAPPAAAATDCTFTTADTTMALDGDCTTDTTITIPDGFTLDGQGHTITAVDPPGDHFRGAVVANAGDTAHVTHLGVTASGLSNACDGGADRLRGILLDGASGSITHSRIIGINQGTSGCQEGNAVEVRNAPFDGTHPDTRTIVVSHNVIDDYQKTGIVANGDVAAHIHHNEVGSADLLHSLAANSVQIGFGAAGAVEHNRILGNQWCGPSNFVATAILAFLPENGTTIAHNHIAGNSDVGVYLLGDAATVGRNRVQDDRGTTDCNAHGHDYGYIDAGSDNTFGKNHARGFDTPFSGVSGGGNRALPGSNLGQPWY